MRSPPPDWAVLNDVPGQSRSSSINTTESGMIDELLDTPRKRKAILPSLSSRKRHKISPNQGSSGVSKLKPKPAQLFSLDSPNTENDSESTASPPPASIVDDYHRRRSIQEPDGSLHKSRIKDRRTVSSPALRKASIGKKPLSYRSDPDPGQNKLSSDVIDISDDEEEPTTYNSVTTSQATYSERNNKGHEVIVIDDSDADLGHPEPSRTPFRVASAGDSSSKSRPRPYARKSMPKPKPKARPVPVRVDDDFDLPPIVVNRRTFRSSFPEPTRITGNGKGKAVHPSDSSPSSVQNSPEQLSLIIEPTVIEPVNTSNEDTSKQLPPNLAHSAISDPSPFAKSPEFTVFEDDLSPELQVDPEPPVLDDYIPQPLQEPVDVEVEPVQPQPPQQVIADPPSVRSPSPDDDPGFVPQLRVKSMLYGGENGFFKEAFLAVRKDNFAFIPSPKTSLIDAELPVSQTKAQAADSVISPEPDSPSADSLNIVSHRSLSEISLTDVIDSAYVNSSTGKSPEHKPSSGSPIAQSFIARTPGVTDQVSLANLKEGPPTGAEIIDLTADSDSDDYHPSVIAAAIAFDEMLSNRTKRTERTDDSTQSDGSHNAYPLCLSKPEIQSSGETLTPFQIIRNAATQKNHHHAEAVHLPATQTSEIVSIEPAQHQSLTPIAVASSASECARAEIQLPKARKLTDPAPEKTSNHPQDEEDEPEAECLETLQYPPSSDDESNTEENYLDPEPTISSSSTMSSNELVTLDSDVEDDPHVHIYRNSSEPYDLINTRAITPRQASWAEFPPVRFTKDIPHLIQDRINQMDEFYRSSDMARIVFESAILENTAEDEPNAPSIKVYNDVDDEATPPWEFHYSNRMWLGEGVPTPDYRNLKGCGCRGRCDPKSKTCLCIKRQEQYSDGRTGFSYDDKGRLRDESVGSPVLECNELCGCTDDCPNRIVQQGRRYPVDIIKTKLKGWGVFAGKKIPASTYLGIYAGEYLIEQVAEERGLKYNKFGRTYLFDVDCQYLKPPDVPAHEFSAKYVVDAYHVGNFTRFLNHSCDPNCLINPVVINDDAEKPMLAIFTSVDVEPNEELCFSYCGPEEETTEGKPEKAKDDAIYVKCCCGASNCTGKMFTI